MFGCPKIATETNTQNQPQLHVCSAAIGGGSHVGFQSLSGWGKMFRWRELFAVTHPDKVIGEQPPASTQLALPPSSFISPYVHDDVTRRQAQLIVLLSLIIKLHHGFHCVQRAKERVEDQITLQRHHNLQQIYNLSLLQPFWFWWLSRFSLLIESESRTQIFEFDSKTLVHSLGGKKRHLPIKGVL